MKKYAAVDLGADSGRVIIGTVDRIEEVHRFANGPVRIGNSIYWNFLGLFTEIKKGLTKAFEKASADGDRIVGIGIDTWGVDFALLDADGDLIGNPYHYRDDRTDGIPEELFRTLPLETVYDETGIQIMQINTIFQLYAFGKRKPDLLAQAKTLLTVPALLSYWLTGVAKNEFSHATTTQLYNPRTGDWSAKIIEALGLERSLFAPIVPSGTRLGTLLPHVAREIGAPEGVEVIATGSHDTASAVAAVPAPGREHYAYLSSGTWSLLGIESPQPIVSEASRRHNFTNEGAANGKIRFLKNIMGLWILQESKRHWESEGAKDTYDELSAMAEAESGTGFTMDVDDARFLKPSVLEDSMPGRIAAYCRETGQTVPTSKAAIVRGIYEGLAAKYAENIAKIEEITASKIEELYIVGGGSRDDYLCRLAAKASGIPVFAGPKEATAIGNILIQSIATGEIGSFDEGRELIRKSYDIKRYEP
jgi:rhamnulokinase